MRADAQSAAERLLKAFGLAGWRYGRVSRLMSGTTSETDRDQRSILGLATAGDVRRRRRTSPRFCLRSLGPDPPATAGGLPRRGAKERWLWVTWTRWSCSCTVRYASPGSGQHGAPPRDGDFRPGGRDLHYENPRWSDLGHGCSKTTRWFKGSARCWTASILALEPWRGLRVRRVLPVIVWLLARQRPSDPAGPRDADGRSARGDDAGAGTQRTGDDRRELANTRALLYPAFFRLTVPVSCPTSSTDAAPLER